MLYEVITKAGKESYSMCKSLHDYRMSQKTLDKINKAKEHGYEIKNFEYKYALDLLEFLRVEFGGGSYNFV